ncbi:protein SMAX1-LIKE 7-like [Cynara cardunculus var. scolymus]|uniref:protein SMAX1-LIKE 7-like n=1 Tax=Cynara cardunculus var. scolymus TaxID=59895 RepID=UPI000D62DA0D|nr:protein SMAX1-LIKE 7-like [Cynara cardunculus var. scolymus]
MPTPVNIARQCLAPEAVQALDEAVAVAHRRCHAQTSSLHAVSALLSLASSPLREACGRARNSAYASRIQFKALELRLGVSLDRLPSTPQRVEEPPVSNSLMAAIKRSQANQRRQPENFHLYQQTAACSPSSASVSVVKVELQNLILSILDDPVVSRVFAESGFRSSDIKLSILRPIQRQLLRCKGLPIFLCNLTNNYGFPYHGFLENNEIYKRINEVLVRKPGKRRNNPLLVGASAIDAVRIFLETLQKRKNGAFSPPELSGLTVICIKDEILNFVSGNSDVSLLQMRLDEVGSVLKQSIGPGVIVEYGDLKALIGENSADAVTFLIRKLGGLLSLHSGRFWLIGAAESHETCIQFFKKFPTVEEEWGLHVLPINSIRPAMAETFPKSSLMESFVPFGGFFSVPTDIKTPFRIRNHFGSLCHICDEKFKLEVNAVSKGLNGSVSDHHRSSLPSWLRTSQDVVQAQDDPVVASAKVIGLQKKWHNICQRLHQGEPYVQMLPKSTYTVGPHVPSVVGFQVVESSKQNVGDHNASSIESGSITISKSNSKNVKDSPIVCSLSGSSEDTASPVSGTSVTTDLGLGVNRSSSSFPVSRGQFDQKDLKLLYSSLFTKVGRQGEALGVVNQTIARCRTRPGSNQGGIWFGFMGPDRDAKKKISVALAEVLLGGRENMICVDLSCQDFMDGFDIKLRGKNVIDFIADELMKKQLSVVFLENVDMADTLTQHHLSLAASTRRFSDSHGREVSISNAIFVLTSKFFGLHELEGVDYTEEIILKAKHGSIRLLTGFDLGDMKPSPKAVRVTRNEHTGSPVCKNKRKLDGSLEAAKRGHRTTTNNLYLDLNLPAEEGDTDYDSAPENSHSWLEDLLQNVDEKVVFKPFDFDAVAEKILKQIGDCFEKSVGLDCLLEIDFKLMEQILKNSCFLETLKTEDWIKEVLGEAFAEAGRKYDLGSHSVVKLIAGEVAEEQPSGGGVLPDKIIVS